MIDDDSMSRLILGFATTYGVEHRDGAPAWYAEQFARFAADPALMGYPRVLAGHEAPMEPRERLGYWYAFRSVKNVEHVPAGLLALGLFTASPSARTMAEFVASDPQAWSLSVRVGDVSDANDGSELYVTEVSLTKKPAVPNSRVLGMGESCRSLWEMYTRSPMPEPPDVPTTTVYGRLVPKVGGGFIREQWEEPTWLSTA